MLRWFGSCFQTQARALGMDFRNGDRSIGNAHRRNLGVEGPSTGFPEQEHCTAILHRAERSLISRFTPTNSVRVDRMVNQYLTRFVPQSSKQGLGLDCLSVRSKTHDAQ